LLPLKLIDLNHVELCVLLLLLLSSLLLFSWCWWCYVMTKVNGYAQEMELVTPLFYLLARHWQHCTRVDNHWPLLYILLLLLLLLLILLH
jgi:hypothetical protein